MHKKVVLPIAALALTIIILVITLSNYQQNKNIEQVISQELDGRLIPHKANYTSKLKNIFKDGLRSFEFDTLFNSDAPTPFFEIGHDEDEVNGVSFEDYLNLNKDKPLKKVWMDVKNADESNISGILARLNYLEKKFNVKDILIFESDATTPKLKQISDAGYHTSYYVPKSLLQNLLDQDITTLQQEASRIHALVEAQNLAAISFRLDLYPFVKTYIEKLIPDNIVYHTWGKHQLKQSKVLQHMQHEDFYQDERVKTIIYAYYNNKLNRLIDF